MFATILLPGIPAGPCVQYIVASGAYRINKPIPISPAVAVKIVSVLNYKGGVGKTTLSACAGQALALTGFRVLAIDNDPQHNLTSMLGGSTVKPTIRDVYHAHTIGLASQQLLKAARKTNVANLHVVPSTGELCTNDIKDPRILQKCFAYSKLERFYDFAIIDNSPGMDVLQEAAIHASTDIFVPTELSQFALDGVGEMHDMLFRRFGGERTITRIIPNFYRSVKAHDSFVAAFRERFPDQVTQTMIPFDSVFDTLVKEEKVLFVHRLSSRAAAFYLKLVHELFDLDEKATWALVMSRRTERLNNEATQRLEKLRRVAKKEPVSAGNSSLLLPADLPSPPVSVEPPTTVPVAPVHISGEELAPLEPV
jgi:chromosome partitioning protein